MRKRVARKVLARTLPAHRLSTIDTAWARTRRERTRDLQPEDAVTLRWRGNGVGRAFGQSGEARPKVRHRSVVTISMLERGEVVPETCPTCGGTDIALTPATCHGFWDCRACGWSGISGPGVPGGCGTLKRGRAT